MGGNVAFILVWLLQIALSIGIIVGSPRVPGVSDKVEGKRMSAVIAGFFPCVGVMLILQLIYFGQYRAALARHQVQQRAAQASLVVKDFEGFPSRPRTAHDPTAPSANPFDEAPNIPFDN